MFPTSTHKTVHMLLVFAGLMVAATPGLGQAFSAQITGPSAWTDGVAVNVTWSYTGTPSALLTQQGVRVWSTMLNGNAWSSSLTNAVAFTARSASTLTQFRNTSNYTIQIVLKDANGNPVTRAYQVSVKPGTGTTPAPPATGNPATVSAACKYVLGVDCMASGNAFASVGSYLVGNPAQFPTQSAMQTYLTNYIGTNPTVKSAVVSAASAGQNLCTQAITALTGAFTASATPASGLWNSYTQLVPLVPVARQSQCTANPAYITAACQYELGVDCSAGNAGSTYNSLASYFKANPALFPTQAAMQTYLINYVQQNPSLKTTIIQQAATAQASGSPAVCAPAQTALVNAFTPNSTNTTSGLWNSYSQLVSMLPGVVKGQCAPKPTAVVNQILVNVNGVSVYLPSQLGGKCMTVEGQAITASTTYAGARIIGYQCQAVTQERFVFMNNGQLRDHDGQNMCLDLNGSQVVTEPCSTAASQVWGLYGDGTVRSAQSGMCMDLQGGAQNWLVNAVQQAVNWQQPVVLAGCNGSAEQKWAVSTALPSSANHSPANTAVVRSGQLSTLAANFVGQNGSSVASGGSNAANPNGANIVASGGGNIVASGGGNLTLNTIGGAVLSKSPAEIVASGGGNIVASGGGNIVASGAGNIITTSNSAGVIIPISGAAIVASGGGNAVQINLGAGLLSLPYQGGTLINATGVTLMPASGLVGSPK